ncbi:MAG: carbohydrate ABC transporter permease [Clostridiales bacterium]|nr:carbohydrate ABC transporter permease [Clostridiales bacterium]
MSTKLSDRPEKLPKANRNELPPLGRVINAVFLVLIFLIMLLPMVNVLAISLSSNAASQVSDVTLWPKNFSTEGYTFIWNAQNLGRAFGNSSFVSVVGTLFTVFISSMAGYALIQRELPFRKAIATGILITMMIPGDLTLVSIFSLNKALGLIDSYRGLILNGLVSAFSIMLMRNYFLSVPESLAESGRIDNASELRIFLSIYLPLSLPGLAAITFLEFIGKWNSFMVPLIITTKPQLFTLPIILRQLTQPTDSTSGVVQIYENARMAAIVITVIPLLVLYSFAQRFLIGGLTLGASKG